MVYENVNPFEKSRKLFETDRYTVLPKYLNCLDIHTWLEKLDSLDTKRVVCGDPNISWNEIGIPTEHTIYNYFMSKEILQLIKHIDHQNSRKEVAKLVTWGCKYGLGEYINLHTDTQGNIQMLICLDAPDKKNGGVLHVRNSEGSFIPMFLSAGDAVIFRATEVPHFTTPIEPSADCKQPRRLVVIARFFYSSNPKE